MIANTQNKIELDQHFLIDKEIIQTMIDSAEFTSKDIVLEIGAGKGAITRELSKKCKKVIAVEIDNKLIKELKSLPDNVEVICGDILEKINSLIFNKIISNLPFSIFEPLLKKIIKKKIDCCIFLLSKKFTKLLKSESKWAFIIPLFFDVIIIKDVNKKAFNPAPRTESVLIKLIRSEKELSGKELLIKEFILQDDKKVKNALMYAMMRADNTTKKIAREKISLMKLPQEMLEENVDNISNEEFLEIKNIIPAL